MRARNRTPPAKAGGIRNYQRVIDALAGTIQFVQVGEAHHLHKTLPNVIDLIGRTDVRQLIRLCWHAEGGIGPVTFIQHIFAQRLCEHPIIGDEAVPKCMALIEPGEVVRAILRYYEGGVLTF